MNAALTKKDQSRIARSNRGLRIQPPWLWHTAKSGYHVAFIATNLKTPMKRFALCCFLTLLLLTGCKKDVSGSYLAADSASVCWLQLVRTPDDHVSGQLVCSVLKPDGDKDNSSVTLAGAVDGENIVLTGGGFLGIATTTLSGTFDGNALSLSRVESTPFVLRRASTADYQAKLSEQTTRSQAIRSAHAMAVTRQQTAQTQRNFVAAIDHLAGRMQQFNMEADAHLGRFPNAEKKYNATTLKVSEYVAQERQLVGNPNRAVDRSQLYVAATQASLKTDQMHFEGQALQSSLETNVAPLAREVTALATECSQSGPIIESLTPAEIQAHQGACDRLLGSAPIFRQKYLSVISGLTHLEEVYNREKKAQERLLATGRKME